MSAWHDIENTLTQVLAGLSANGQPLLATVRAHSPVDRRRVRELVTRERLPAAVVAVTGRDQGDRSMRRPGAAVVTVWLATGSHRNSSDARVGATDVTGLYDVAEQAAAGLQDLAIGTDRRVLLIDEQPHAIEDGLGLWEQRYEIRREAETVAPTFGAVALAGADSVMRVEVGPRVQAVSTFSFPGVDGVFARQLGRRERMILWRGQLRADDDAALNAIEAALEDEVQLGAARTMVDAWGRSHDDCVMAAFRRKGPRQRDARSGQALQDVEIEFRQLGG